MHLSVKTRTLVSNELRGNGDMSLTHPAQDADIVQSLDALLRA
jgi:hypothetical protein